MLRRSIVFVLGATIALLPLAAPASVGAAGARTSLPFTWTFTPPAKGGPWTLKGSVLSYDGTSSTSLAAPLTLPRGVPIAVQAEIRIPGSGPYTAEMMGAGVYVRSRPARIHSQVSAGSFLADSITPEAAGPQLVWHSITIGGSALDPGTTWHTYRLEIRGTLYTLSIDGRQVVQYVLPGAGKPVQAGVFSVLQRMQVRSFTVRRLPAGVSDAAPYPDLSTLAVRLADLPPTLSVQPYMQHVYTNAQTAERRKMSVAELEATGRITSYAVEYYVFSLGISDVYSDIAAYRSPAQARADMATTVARLRTGAAQIPGEFDLHDVPVTSGDTGSTWVFYVNVQGSKVGFLYSMFARGSYVSEMSVPFDTAGVTESDVVAMVQRLDDVVNGRLAARP